MWMAHLPGQHYDVRLTAPDGYRAQRSYSIASSPLDEGEIELTVATCQVPGARCTAGVSASVSPSNIAPL